MTAGEYAGISFGIVLILVVAFMTITVLCIPKIVVKTAPKDIQEIITKRPDSPLWETVIGIALAVAIIACILGIFVWVGWDAVQHNIGFGLLFPRYVILLVGFKLFDMICFDWILLTKLNIFQTLFTETIGCEEYEAFGFNFKSQVVKICVFILLSAVLAAIVVRL